VAKDEMYRIFNEKAALLPSLKSSCTGWCEDVSAGLIPGYYMVLFHILNAAGIIVLIFAMPFWATTYIIGWIVGLWIFSSSGLLNAIDYFVYLVPLIIILALRIWKNLTN